MLAKLAVRNVRRSARDYGVFFVTVALGVAMFYAFNAIKSQAVLYDAMTVNSLRMLELLDMMMGIFSVAVACVLGFLVVYANRFIIKRRKREFGMYLMLGMGAPRCERHPPVRDRARGLGEPRRGPSGGHRAVPGALVRHGRSHGGDHDK